MLKQIQYILLTLSFLSVVVPLNGQEISSKKSKCSYCKRDKKDHNHKDPYTVNFKNEIPYFATGIGLLGSGFTIKLLNERGEFSIEEINQLDQNEVNSFDRVAISNNSASARDASDVILYGGLILPIYFLSNHHTKKDFSSLLLMSSEILILTNSLTLNAKYAFNRTRPTAYNSSFPIESRIDKGNRISFFSGHTAQTAGFSVFIAKVMTDYHPDMNIGKKVGLWSFAFGLPALTGFLRVKGGRHYPTDVITGFAIGSAIGWLVPHLHKKKENSKLTLSPFNYDDVLGLSVRLKLD